MTLDEIISHEGVNDTTGDDNYLTYYQIRELLKEHDAARERELVELRALLRQTIAAQSEVVKLRMAHKTLDIYARRACKFCGSDTDSDRVVEYRKDVQGWIHPFVRFLPQCAVDTERRRLQRARQAFLEKQKRPVVGLKLTPREWLLTGGGGHEGGVDGLRALSVTGEGLVDFLDAYHQWVLEEIASDGIVRAQRLIGAREEMQAQAARFCPMCRGDDVDYDPVPVADGTTFYFHRRLSDARCASCCRASDIRNDFHIRHLEAT